MDKPRDFIDWCGELGYELPVPLECIEPTKDGFVLNEKRARTGVREALYPPQYFGGQYPDLWKIPATADAAYYLTHKTTVKG